MIKNYVDEITDAFDSLREKYDDIGLALNLLGIAVNARNADRVNANISGSLVVKENKND